MNRPQTLILLNKQHPDAWANKLPDLEQLNLVTQIVDFNRLEEALPLLAQLVHEQELDFLLFAQNDQVLEKKDIGPLIRALRAGYSSFSGIDDAAYLAQTQQCLNDFITAPVKLDLAPGKKLVSAWQPGASGFSLIFDTEQMGGVRFGLPRILDLLEAYHVPATFFVTGFVATVYPDLLPILQARGHSIGIHGRYHEYLSGLDRSTQIQQLEEEKKSFERYTRIRGANLIFRMDKVTVEAMVACGFDYFVVSMEHLYSLLAYRKMPVQPFRIWTDQGCIWMVPVSVETYNRPLQAVQLSTSSAFNQARREQAPAVNILMHPFRDGSLRHLGPLEKLLQYLQTRWSDTPATIDHIIEQMPRLEPTVYIYVDGLNGGEMAGYGNLARGGVSNWRWHNLSHYWQRVARIYTSLIKLGHVPALCLSCPEKAPIFAVYPYLPGDARPVISVELDPLVHNQTDGELLSVLDMYVAGKTNKIVTFGPGSSKADIKAAWGILSPKQIPDWLGFLPEGMTRFINRATGYRHIF